ncbi:hypothetical protein AB0L57_25435 [Nocardia sp. NPDC052254]|uniref:hypothetical protein n=1 Tax=Nocardia sp. NPDC052254 TaxID=3155681 RepID=UPI003433EE08
MARDEMWRIALRDRMATDPWRYVPAPTSDDHDWARANPGTWRYFVDPHVDPETSRWPQDCMSGWGSDDYGQLTRVWLNPDFEPSPGTAHMPLTTEFELVLWRTARGFVDFETFIGTFADSWFLVAAAPDGVPTETRDGVVFLIIYSSSAQLGEDMDPSRFRRVSGRELLVDVLPGKDFVVNINVRNGVLFPAGGLVDLWRQWVARHVVSVAPSWLVDTSAEVPSSAPQSAQMEDIRSWALGSDADVPYAAPSPGEEIPPWEPPPANAAPTRAPEPVADVPPRRSAPVSDSPPWGQTPSEATEATASGTDLGNPRFANCGISDFIETRSKVLPEPRESDFAWAREHPGEWHHLVGARVDKASATDADIIGGWLADRDGGLLPWLNPAFVPVPGTTDAPITNHIELTIFRAEIGAVDLGEFIHAFSTAEFIMLNLEDDPDGARGWPLEPIPGGGRALKLYTSEEQLPQGINPRLRQRVSGLSVLVDACSLDGTVVVLNSRNIPHELGDLDGWLLAEWWKQWQEAERIRAAPESGK